MQEPLEYAGMVDKFGSLVVPEGGMLHELHAHSTRWQIKRGALTPN